MPTTTRFGLDEQSSDKFFGSDRVLIDKLLTVLADYAGQGDALADPVGPGTATQSTSGGQIPSGGTRYYRYTLLDQYGLETTPSPELPVVMPAAPFVDAFPVLTGDYDGASALDEGTYYYALTGDTAAGETAIGPESVITVQPGQNEVVIVIPALSTGITAWNVWRQNVIEDGWTKVFDSHAPGTVTDVGYPSGDCLCDPATQPPVGNLSEVGSNTVTVTPKPADLALTGVTGWRLYVTTISGFYGSASLVATVVPTTVGGSVPTSYVDTGAALLTGLPPVTSTTLKPLSGGGGGGTGGGGADSHLMTNYAFQHLDTVSSGDEFPVYVVDASTWDRVGHDIAMIYNASQSDDGDELQISTDGVYTLFARLSMSGAAGDTVQISPVWVDTPAGPQFTQFLPQDLGQATIPTGATQYNGGFSFGPVFLPKGTRVAFKVTAYFAGTAPNLLIGVGAAMASGTPIDAEVLTAPDFTVTDAGTGGTINLNWTVDPDVDDCTIIIYKDGVKDSVYGYQSAGNSTLSGLTDDTAYAVFMIARKNFGSYTLYSMANREDVVPTTTAPAAGPISEDYSGFADGTVLGPPNWTQGAAPGSLQTLGGKVINQGGMFGPRFAMHDFGAADKAIALVHNAVATHDLVVYLAATDAEGGDPSVSLGISGDGSAPGMTYNDGVGSGNVNTTLVAAGGSTWVAYDGGSSGPFICQIEGTTVEIYNSDGLCWSGTIPAPVASTMAGFGLFASGGSINGITISAPIF